MTRQRLVEVENHLLREAIRRLLEDQGGLAGAEAREHARRLLAEES